MKIEDKCTERIPLNRRINDNLIYEVDIYIDIVKIKKLKKGLTKERRSVILKDWLWENNPGPANEKYFNEKIEMNLNLKDSETMEISKIVLKKEISCSFYER